VGAPRDFKIPPRSTKIHLILQIGTNPLDASVRHKVRLTDLETYRPKEAVRCFEKTLFLEDRADSRRLMERAYENLRDWSSKV